VVYNKKYSALCFFQLWNNNADDKTQLFYFRLTTSKTAFLDLGNMAFSTPNKSVYPRVPYFDDKELRICVTGAGGFIGGALAKRLKEEGHFVVACDWKRQEHMEVIVLTYYVAAAFHFVGQIAV